MSFKNSCSTKLIITWIKKDLGNIFAKRNLWYKIKIVVWRKKTHNTWIHHTKIMSQKTSSKKNVVFIPEMQQLNLSFRPNGELHVLEETGWKLLQNCKYTTARLYHTIYKVTKTKYNIGLKWITKAPKSIVSWCHLCRHCISFFCIYRWLALSMI